MMSAVNDVPTTDMILTVVRCSSGRRSMNAIMQPVKGELLFHLCLEINFFLSLSSLKVVKKCVFLFTI